MMQPVGAKKPKHGPEHNVPKQHGKKRGLKHSHDEHA
jgi:hypothetical protein